jgi:hypothetical protein
MQLTPFEILTILVTVFGCWYAITTSGAVPRQVWRTPASAFGVSILTLGMAGTTAHLLDGLNDLLGATKATRVLAFDATLDYAYRPLWLSLIALALFVTILRSASQGDVPGAPSIGAVLSWLMIFCGFGSMIGIAAYHGAMMLEYDLKLLVEWATFAFYLQGVTLTLCLIGGTMTLVQGADVVGASAGAPPTRA